MSSAFFRAPVESTVIRRTQAKGRSPLQPQRTFQTQSPPHSVEALSFSSPPTSARSMNATTNSSSPRNSTTPKNSTGQTSMDSVPNDGNKNKDPNNSNGVSSPERRTTRRNHHHNAGYITSHLLGRHHKDRDHDQPNDPDGTRDNSPDSTLTTIQETPLDQASPGIMTIERAAAAKINLETYYQELLFSGPSAREIRSQLLEAHLLSLSRQRRHSLSDADMQAMKARFYRRETEYLREMRVLKTKSMRALRESKNCTSSVSNDYEELRILGKGSFGVVKLVREKTEKRGQAQVYAMKCIRKGDMLKTQQESHLKAERDFLVASEGSRWIIQLVASFQDLRNLYLVTEYMPGGDFLGFLIRENVLEEHVARFYVAEMILCVEAAHSLKFIHRDIKPDNFLISASGHLKISDFGLAFDGGWLHDMAYYNSQRYSLVNKLGIVVEGDEKDRSDLRSMQETMKWTSTVMTGIEKHCPKENSNNDGQVGAELLNWRNRYGNRAAARSVIGTSQYMAPEVVLGDNYDGRNLTKKNILDHKNKLNGLPIQNVSGRCKDLMNSLITEKENRLCSKRYRMKDLVMDIGRRNGGSRGNGMGNGSMSAAAMYTGGGNVPGVVTGSNPVSEARLSRDYAGRYVFPYDAEDIKAHKWFRSIPWERLHQMTPPHVPHLRSCDDTAYFDDKSISDWSDTEPEMIEVEREPPETPPGLVYDDDEWGGISPEPGHPTTPGERYQPQPQEGQVMSIRGGVLGMPPFTPVHKPRDPEEEQITMHLSPMSDTMQKWALAAISMPIDRRRLAEIEGQIGCIHGLSPWERDYLREFLAQKKKKNRRPRDKILRDKKMARIALEERRRTAFGGYEWKRIRDEDDDDDQDGNEMCGDAGCSNAGDMIMARGCDGTGCDDQQVGGGADGGVRDTTIIGMIGMGLDGEFTDGVGWMGQQQQRQRYTSPGQYYHGWQHEHHPHRNSPRPRLPPPQIVWSNHQQPPHGNQYATPHDPIPELPLPLSPPAPQHGQLQHAGGCQQRWYELHGGVPHQHHQLNCQRRKRVNGGFGELGHDVAMVRALHRGRHSLR
ncbi:serine/threonine-protein kinase [Cladorrhinum samala]|uniref:non-specific serine/threonine protein kinase n=1 Tax=Cladorrhinum samala TaxID=585594 RepID=A0AAV9HME5_9PEZI|nr:serine/threonine-protein kinase [Cladorrhinum samala]